MSVIQPVGKRIVAKVIKQEQKTASGLIMTTQQDAPSNIAEVLYVGNDVEGIFVGDTILMLSHAPFTFEGHELVTLMESDVLGRVK